jgi:hypothetical protein
MSYLGRKKRQNTIWARIYFHILRILKTLDSWNYNNRNQVQRFWFFHTHFWNFSVSQLLMLDLEKYLFAKKFQSPKIKIFEIGRNFTYDLAPSIYNYWVYHIAFLILTPQKNCFKSYDYHMKSIISYDKSYDLKQFFAWVYRHEISTN